MLTVTVCAPTGLLPGPNCPSRVAEWFAAGAEPEDTERYYVLDGDGMLVVNMPTEARPWAARAGVRLAEVTGDGSAATVSIVQPAEGAVLFIAPELHRQQAMLRAAAPAGVERIEFRVNGVAVGTASGADAFVVWPMTTGQHTLQVVATFANGATAAATTRYEVREP